MDTGNKADLAWTWPLILIQFLNAYHYISTPPPPYVFVEWHLIKPRVISPFILSFVSLHYPDGALLQVLLRIPRIRSYKTWLSYVTRVNTVQICQVWEGTFMPFIDSLLRDFHKLGNVLLAEREGEICAHFVICRWFDWLRACLFVNVSNAIICIVWVLWLLS
jgi:hypothetical protein